MSWKTYLIFFVLCLLLFFAAEARELDGDNSNLVFKADYSTNRYTLNENNSLLVYNTKTGTQPQVIIGNNAVLDVTPTNKPPNVVDSNNLFNFKLLNTEVVWAALSLVLNNSFGAVDFNELIDISSRETVDLDSYVEISSNYIFINDTSLKELNKSAEVTIKELTFSNIRILKNGEDCLGCTILSYSGGDVKFNVSGFAIYQAADGSVSPAIRIATNVIVTNASMSVAGDTYNGVYPNNLTIDVGGDGVAEFSSSGEFSSSTVFANFTDALNDIFPECSCNGCTLSNSDLTCTIVLNISSDTAGTVELSNLNVSQIINNASWNEDNSYNLIDLDDYFYDLDRDALSYFYSPMENITVSVDNGIVSFTPDSNFFGNRSIVFNASDGTNITLSNYVNLSVVSVNDVPVFSGEISDWFWLKDKNITNVFDLDDYFSDVETENLSYSTTGNVNVTVDIDENNSVSFFPDLNWTGQETVYFTGSDGGLSANSNNILLNVSGGPTPSAPAGDAGGESGADIEVPVKRVIIKEFNVSIDKVKSKLVTGESEKKRFVVTNAGNVKMKFRVEVKAVEDFVFIIDKEFILYPGQAKSVNVDILAGPKYGIYSGEIVIIGEGVEKTIPVVLEVVTKKILFDVKIDVPLEYKEIYPGENLRAQVTLLNIMGGTADVLINYLIKDLNGYVLYEESETFAVEDQASYAKSFETSMDWITGDYLVAIESMYGNSYAVSSEMFRLKEEERLAPEEVKDRLFLILILVISIVLFIAAFIVLSKKPKKRRKRT
ncbi:hypothetical protein CMO89_02255 [Candidatus Woesearchaeota archaeon]|nr:hypothetical protein [Candidatus Woesearchaeota archaeon]|tara:strand:- start:2617 stop:4941 length:2325 start_codon:yes stop_codon:yes gene_type:complete